MERKAIRILSVSRLNSKVTNFRVNSSSDARKHYTVQRRGSRIFKCSCNGWIFPRIVLVKGKAVRMRCDCRHIKHVRKAA